SVVAEGVERPEQAEKLKAFGCEEAQGFLYSRPIEASAFAAFAASWSGGAAGV
ncbi:MAG: EAL domain-containing protein, partial [Pseudomonadota bacterium]